MHENAAYPPSKPPMQMDDQAEGCITDVTNLESKSTILKNRLFYAVKPIVPRSMQLSIRRMIVRRKRGLYSHLWPIDQRAGVTPEGWPGWPEKKRFALVLMHDVDTAAGHSKCFSLAALEKKHGFRSSINFVPERYTVSREVIDTLKKDGFEVGVHGLKHDGKLFVSKQIFDERAIHINKYLKDWNADGFSSPSMHRNLKWVHALNIKYDTSTFDTDPFEPQPDGVCTIFPFWVVNGEFSEGYTELPYTLPQDHGLFVIMQEKSIRIWKEKLDWISEKGGMALLNTHPDYMNYGEDKCGREEYPAEFYSEFLEYVKKKYEGKYWHALPRDVAKFWRENMVGTRDTIENSLLNHD